MSKKNKWPELGIITKNEVKDKEGNTVRDKQGNPVTRLAFKLNDEIYEVLRKAGYNVSQYGVMKTPVEEVEGLIKAGVIEESEVEKRKESAKSAHTWLRYKIQMPPLKEDRK